MSFYQLLFSKNINGVNRNLTWYWNLFAKYMRENVGTLLAKILKIKGNTIVWNQLFSDGNFESSLVWYAGSGTRNISGNVGTFTATSGKINITCSVTGLVASHKYYVAFDMKSDVSLSKMRYRLYSTVNSVTTGDNSVSTSWARYSSILSTNSTFGGGNERFYIYPDWDDSFPVGSSIYIRKAVLIDLTQMFGSGNEPTIAEFEALFPLSYYAYDSGSLLSFNGSGIKTVGFNQWDEEWESGAYNQQTGAKMSASNIWRCTNYISVIPNETYYFKVPITIRVFWYDGNHNFLDSDTVLNGTRTVPSGAVFLTFHVGQASYNNDVCINISDANKNGTYEPYTSNTLPLPISTYFPTGMKSAGTVYDELTENKAIAKLGRYVCTGTDGSSWSLWTHYGAYTRFDNSSVIAKNATKNFVSNSFDNKLDGGETQEGILFHGVAGRMVLHIQTSKLLTDDVTGLMNYFSAHPFEIFYELATPTEVSIDPPLDLSYEIEWGGTEQLLPENTSTPTTSPISATVEYPDGEHEDYYTYQEIEKNHLRLNRALSIMLGRNVIIENPQEPLNIIMRGE